MTGIVADTGAVVALIDADDQHHSVLLAVYEQNPDSWVLPWAILPEVDYLLSAHVGDAAQQAFMADLADGRYTIEWGRKVDLSRARELHTQYGSLALGLVDCIVMAIAERLGAQSIASLDERDFGAVTIAGAPRLLPRDLG